MGVIRSFAENPRPHGTKKLTDREGYRLRVGRWRILYRVIDKEKQVFVRRVVERNERTYR